jgi:MFS transporter, DHA3 family, macrolide efflux protein
MRRTAAHGMRIYLLIWFGQLVSALGTGLGSFALGVWVYQTTSSVTHFTMIAFVAGVTMMLVSPFAGSFADRFDRRKIMLWADTGSGLTTLLMAWLLFTERMEPWHVYPIVAVMVGLTALQGPALQASISMLVPREQYGRALGLSQTSRGVVQIVAPLAAGVLIGKIDYHGVLLIDFVTFLFAAGTLLIVRIPSPPRRDTARRSVLGDFAFGWTYLWQRSGLFALLSMYALTNFCMGMVQVLLAPLILSFATPLELGSVNSAAAGGVLLGGIALAVWGGPKRRIWGIFTILLVQGGLLFLGGFEPSVPLIAMAAFAFMVTVPIINGSNQGILLSKVARDVQGRVFAMSGMIAAGTLPLASLIAGPLADRVFGPLLVPGGALADSVGRVIGVGPSRGIGLLFVTLGVLVIVIVLLSFLNPRLRRVETEVPDAIDLEEETTAGEVSGARPELQRA